MKINQVTSGRADIMTGGVQKKVGGIQEARPGTIGEGGNVYISSLSVSMQSPGVSGETINAVKVAEIKQAISEGRFKVNSEAVADRLLETVKELIQNKR